jgi:Protein of unknown function (DUF3489)
MTKSIAEETGMAPTGSTGRPKPGKKARVAAKRAHVAAKRAKAAKKANLGKKTPTGAKTTRAARPGSKAAMVMDLLKRPDGVGLRELMKATGWQPHSVRGFLSSTIRKKLAMTVTSTKAENGERTYSVKA